MTMETMIDICDRCGRALKPSRSRRLYVDGPAGKISIGLYGEHCAQRIAITRWKEGRRTYRDTGRAYYFRGITWGGPRMPDA